MKQLFKGIVIGFTIAAVLCGATVWAVSSQQNITVTYRDIKIVVDDMLITPKNANGEIIEPFLHNGTTYLPVRAVADALGKALYWDGPAYTVYIGNMSGKLEHPTLRLGDAETIDNWKWPPFSNGVDYYGNSYVEYWNGVGEVEYLLNMKYTNFKGSLFYLKSLGSGATLGFRIEGDGKVLYNSPLIEYTSAPVKFDVNITGYNVIKIVSTGSNGYIIGDAGFYSHST